MDLHNKKCVPCEGGTKPLSRAEFQEYWTVVPSWNPIEEDKKIQKEFKFKDFHENLEFVNKIGAIAEEEGHHPDLFIHNWNMLTVTLSTYAIGGLSVNDFILASKIDRIK